MLRNLGTDFFKEIFLFQDFNGELLALRPEMTIAITRSVIANGLLDTGPVKLFYISKVFRYSQSFTERKREFNQIGVELFASNSSDCDGEVIALLIDILSKLEISDYRIDLNSSELVESIYNILNITQQSTTSINGIESSNQKFILKADIKRSDLNQDERNYLIDFLNCKTIEELSQYPRSCFNSIDEFLGRITTIYEIVKQYNVQNKVFFDINLLRKIEYYQGIIFEVSLPAKGIKLGGGGRFDKLLRNFGNTSTIGIGFALELEKLLDELAVRSEGVM